MNSTATQPDWSQNRKEKEIENVMGVWSALASMVSVLRHLHETSTSTLCDHRDSNPTDILIPSVRSAKPAAPMTWERARATSAAPAYFDSMALSSLSDTFVDGGLVFNDPAKMSFSEIRNQVTLEPRIVTSIGTAVKPEEARGGPLKQEHGARWLLVFDGVDGPPVKDLSDYKRVLEKDFGFSVRGWRRHSRDPDDDDEDTMAGRISRLSHLQKGTILLASPGLISLINNYATHRHVAQDLPEILRQVAMLMQRKLSEVRDSPHIGFDPADQMQCEPPGTRFFSRPGPEVFLAAAVGLTFLFTKLRYFNNHPSCHFWMVTFCIGAGLTYGVSMKMPLLAIALYVLPWAAYVGCLLAELMQFFFLDVETGENALEEVHRAGGECSTNEEHMIEV